MTLNSSLAIGGFHKSSPPLSLTPSPGMVADFVLLHDNGSECIANKEGRLSAVAAQRARERAQTARQAKGTRHNGGAEERG